MTDKKTTGYLTGKLLLAMPTMTDPRFHKAVIFICAHDEKGAMGLGIHHPVHGMNLGILLKQMKIETGPATPAMLPVMTGGPVETQRGFLVHPAGFRRMDTIDIDRYGVSTTLDALRAVARGEGPDDMMMVLGYAGWSAGQLEREIQENAWLTVDADDDLMFRTQPEDRWDLAFGKIGIKIPAMLSQTAGHA